MAGLFDNITEWMFMFEGPFGGVTDEEEMAGIREGIVNNIMLRNLEDIPRHLFRLV
jgi:hypothetical protein